MSKQIHLICPGEFIDLIEDVDIRYYNFYSNHTFLKKINCNANENYRGLLDAMQRNDYELLHIKKGSTFTVNSLQIKKNQVPYVMFRIKKLIFSDSQNPEEIKEISSGFFAITVEDVNKMVISQN